jgi:hypothetical protein
LRDLATQIAASVPRLDLRLEFAHLAVEFFEVVKQALLQYAKRARQIVGGILTQLGHSCADVANALRDDEAKLSEQSSNLAGLGRACLHETLPNPVQRKYGLLLDIS